MLDLVLADFPKEILDDLECEFVDGASMRMLIDHYGAITAPLVQNLRDALKALLEARVVYRQSDRFYAGKTRHRITLTDRQRANVVRLKSDGLTNKAVAELLSIPFGTVKNISAAARGAQS